MKWPKTKDENLTMNKQFLGALFVKLLSNFQVILKISFFYQKIVLELQFQ